MNTTIIAAQSVKEAAKNANGYTQKGFYAGDGKTWIRCVDYEAAKNSGLMYIFFVDGANIVLYNA